MTRLGGGEGGGHTPAIAVESDYFGNKQIPRLLPVDGVEERQGLLLPNPSLEKD